MDNGISSKSLEFIIKPCAKSKDAANLGSREQVLICGILYLLAKLPDCVLYEKIESSIHFLAECSALIRLRPLILGSHQERYLLWI